MNLSVKLQAFEGPLDLLLHLIDKDKINIYDIPIVDITNQYLEYIKEMKEEDLDLISEFLLMAATLLDIKSRMLLPKQKDENGVEEDPRLELVERLLEYKKFKYISEELKEKQADAEKFLYKLETLPPEVVGYQEPVDIEKLLSDVTLAKLHGIFQLVIKRRVDTIDPIRSKFGKIEKEEVNLTDRVNHILEFAQKTRKFSFRKLLENQKGKMEVIVTFLAILELIKVGKITVAQENIFDDITVFAK